MTLKVPKDIETLVMARVETGDFASAEEVLRDAMKPWLDAERERHGRLAAIKAMIAEADADPVDIPAGDVAKRLDAFAAKLLDRAPDAA